MIIKTLKYHKLQCKINLLVNLINFISIYQNLSGINLGLKCKFRAKMKFNFIVKNSNPELIRT